MNIQIKKKLPKTIPQLPGVYFFKDNAGQVIYIGKAKNLKNRVQSYFQKNSSDWKVQSLLQEHATIDFITTKNEIEACLLEADLISKHKPKFNVLLRDGQPFLYILFTNDQLPSMKVVRNKKTPGSYIGPFLHKIQVRRIYDYLVQTFRLNTCNKTIINGCLDYHIGTCPGTCMPHFNTNEYLFKLNLAYNALKGDHAQFTQEITEKIHTHNAQYEFEKAQNLSQYLINSEIIFDTIKTHFTAARFANDIFVTITQKPAINIQLATDLQQFLSVDHPINTIDCFDISHFQSSYLVGSCVRFTNGVPDKNKFRRFSIKTLTQQNDYAALQEIIVRRYKNHAHSNAIFNASALSNATIDTNTPNTTDTRDALPDLILIDGGKGQLSAARHVLPNAHIVSLAKREERLFTPAHPDGILLDVKTPCGKLLIELRDYAHHFAISYHRLRRKKI